MLWHFLCVIFVLLATSQGAYAMGFGDALALVLGFGISFVAIFACLGCYARQRNLLEPL
jgi:ABC-type nickel/cobalt efflux system permease component RcnA